MRTSPQRQQSDGGMSPGSEGAYAELQLIQQNIQQKKKSQQQQPPPPPKPGQLQRQHSSEYQQHHVSSPSPDRASISSGSSGGSGHYAVPNIAPPSPGSASVIQSLNAKFASLNQQYQDPQYQTNNGGTYVGHGGAGDPSAANLMPPPAPPPNHPSTLRGQGQGHPPPKSAGLPHHTQQSQGRPSHPPVYGHHGQPGPGRAHAHQGHAGNLHAQMQQEGEGEDFPLPPTEEELAEMETLYARPPPVNPKPKMQGNLMMELKRRVSSDEASDV